MRFVHETYIKGTTEIRIITVPWFKCFRMQKKNMINKILKSTITVVQISAQNLIEMIIIGISDVIFFMKSSSKVHFLQNLSVIIPDFTCLIAGF